MSYLCRSRCDMCRTVAGPGATCVVLLLVRVRHMSYLRPSGLRHMSYLLPCGCDICRTFAVWVRHMSYLLPSGCDICRTFARSRDPWRKLENIRDILVELPGHSFGSPHDMFGAFPIHVKTKPRKFSESPRKFQASWGMSRRYPGQPIKSRGWLPRSLGGALNTSLFQTKIWRNCFRSGRQRLCGVPCGILHSILGVCWGSQVSQAFNRILFDVYGQTQCILWIFMDLCARGQCSSSTCNVCAHMHCGCLLPFFLWCLLLHGPPKHRGTIQQCRSAARGQF